MPKAHPKLSSLVTRHRPFGPSSHCASQRKWHVSPRFTTEIRKGSSKTPKGILSSPREFRRQRAHEYPGCRLLATVDRFRALFLTSAFYRLAVSPFPKWVRIGFGPGALSFVFNQPTASVRKKSSSGGGCSAGVRTADSCTCRGSVPITDRGLSPREHSPPCRAAAELPPLARTAGGDAKAIAAPAPLAASVGADALAIDALPPLARTAAEDGKAVATLLHSKTCRCVLT